MILSEKGLSLIKEFEGFRSAAYLCPAGLLTVGYGHLCRREEGYRLGQAISKQTADELLRRDVCYAEDAVRRLVKVPLSQNQFDALVSFVFNLGETTFRKSSVLRNLNANNFERAMFWLSKYTFADKKKLNGLIRRRKAEIELFNLKF